MSGRGKKLKYDKNARANDEWVKSKRTGRPYQMYDEVTKTWKKIEGGAK